MNRNQASSTKHEKRGQCKTMDTKRINNNILKSLIVSVLLLCSNPSHAQWTWRVLLHNGTFETGNAITKQMAVREIRSVCDLCDTLTQTSVRRTGPVSFFYEAPDIAVTEDNFTPWVYNQFRFGVGGSFGSMSAIIARVRETIGRPRPGCPDYTVADQGGTWQPMFNRQLTPETHESYCGGALDYVAGTNSQGFCGQDDYGIKSTSYTGLPPSCISDPIERVVLIDRNRELICPDQSNPGTITVDGAAQWVCMVNVTATITGPASKPDACNASANPCSISTGDKLKTTTDFSSGNLSFTRYYNSLQTANDISIGQGWRHSYSDVLYLQPLNDTVVGYLSSRGRHEDLRRNTNTSYTVDDTDRQFSVRHINKVGDDWHATTKSGATRIYTALGALKQIVNSDGEFLSLEYDASNRLSTITNNYGNGLTLEYQGELISRITQPDGGVIEYNYDENSNLIEVSYPDLTPNDRNDNPALTYHYEDSRFPYHLTGITDENGERTQTYSYNEQGKAISSGKAQTTNLTGQEKIELDFQGAN